jgi:hypothetical protein
MKALPTVVGVVVAVAAVAWFSLVLAFGPLLPVAARTATAATFAVAMLVVLLFVRPLPRALCVVAAGVIVVAVAWSTVRPRNDRDWQPDVAVLPHVDVDGDRLVVHGLRNFTYRSETDYDEHWETRTYDLSKLQRLDLFMSYWGSPAIAHTILSWQFSDGQHLAISIETRKERGESYSAILGFFRQYELYYVVADERDLVSLRTNFRGEDVYLYRLRTPLPAARALLLSYVARINELAKEPVFYNALTQNCTTTIRTHMANAGATVPFDWRYVVNGYADRMLYERGTLDTSIPFDEVRRRGDVVARGRAADAAPDFSARIREGVPTPPLLARPAGT